MTNPEKIELIRIWLGDNRDSDDVLSAYLELAEDRILEKVYQFNPDVPHVMPAKYERRQCEIALYLLNRRGSEGETSHNENGVERAYEAAFVPDSLLKDVTPFASPLIRRKVVNNENAAP